jgi:hypothetical protein
LFFLEKIAGRNREPIPWLFLGRARCYDTESPFFAGHHAVLIGFVWIWLLLSIKQKPSQQKIRSAAQANGTVLGDVHGRPPLARPSQAALVGASP